MEHVERVDIIGCPFDVISFAETAMKVKQAVIENKHLQIVPGSIDTVMKARRNPTFADDVRKSDLVIADGVPIVWAAALLGNHLQGRVSGTDLVWKCAEISSHLRCPVALIGGKPGVAQRAAEIMQRKYTSSRMVALDTPFPLGAEESVALLEKIREAGAKILLVALGAPRQERWIGTYLKKSGANVGIGIGGAFDIISGDMPRAPRIMRDNGFEWLHRMRQEPGRLVRRYLLEDSPFLMYLAMEVLKNKLAKREGA